MHEYSYTAKDKAGKLQQGSLSAQSRQAAASQIIEKGLVPVVINEQKNKFSIKNIHILHRKVPLMEKVVFARQFSTMINAGVPIAKAMAILERQTNNGVMKDVVGELVHKVEGGSALSAALAEYPKVFSPIFINMVKAGELGGTLDKTLARLADQLENDQEVISKVRGAMIYPGVILFIMIGAFIFLMLVIIPQLKTIFEDLGAKLPLATRIMIGISSFLTRYFILVTIFNIGLFFAWQKIYKQPNIKQTVHGMILKLPILGNIIIKVNVARFARTMSSLLTSGVAVLDALQVVRDSLGNVTFKKDVETIAAAVKNGSSVSTPMKKSKVFPALVPQMMAVGEETGTLDEILAKVADFYEKEVSNIVANLSSIIEPLLMVIIGAFVGLIVVAIFTPIISLPQYIQ